MHQIPTKKMDKQRNCFDILNDNVKLPFTMSISNIHQSMEKLTVKKYEQNLMLDEKSIASSNINKIKNISSRLCDAIREYSFNPLHVGEAQEITSSNSIISHLNLSPSFKNERISLLPKDTPTFKSAMKFRDPRIFNAIYLKRNFKFLLNNR